MSLYFKGKDWEEPAKKKYIAGPEWIYIIHSNPDLMKDIAYIKHDKKRNKTIVIKRNGEYCGYKETFIEGVQEPEYYVDRKIWKEISKKEAKNRIDKLLK